MDEVMMATEAQHAREQLMQLGLGQEELEALRHQGFVAPEFRVRAGRRWGHGRHATVCGDLAADPAMAVLLLGLGFHGVSVASRFLGEIKFAVRAVSIVEARRFAEAALAQRSSEGVRQVLEEVRTRLYDERVPEPDPT